ncbi:MAG: hypothetical protein ACTS22_04170 [Phycisphaerales bacterium]
MQMLLALQVDPAPPAGDAPREFDPVWLANVMMTAAVVLLIVVVLGKTRKRAVQRSAEPQLAPAERIAAIRAKAEAEGGAEGRTAQVAQRVRELTAVLDTRIEHLDILIAQADERIRRLEELEATASLPEDLARGDRASSASRPSPPGAVAGKEAIYELADQGLTPGEIAARLGQHAGKVELILALRRV